MFIEKHRDPVVSEQNLKRDESLQEYGHSLFHSPPLLFFSLSLLFFAPLLPPRLLFGGVMW